MLKSVRYTGLRVRELKVDWLQPPAAPTIIVACGPRRISEAMSTTYETDMFEPLAIGNWTLKAEVSDERRTRISSGGTGVSDARCRSTTEGRRAQHDDRDDVPARAGWQIPEQTLEYTASSTT